MGIFIFLRILIILRIYKPNIKRTHYEAGLEFLVLACGAASRKYWVGGGGGEREGLKETQARLRINKEDHFSRISNLYGLNIFVHSVLMISKL